MKNTIIPFDNRIQLYNIAFTVIGDMNYEILHRSANFHRFLLLEGDGGMEIEGRTVFFHSGDIFFIPATVGVRFCVPSPLACYQVFFSGTASPLAAEESLSLPCHREGVQCGKIAREIQQLWRSFQAPDWRSCEKVRANAILHLLLLEWAGIAPAQDDEDDGIDLLMQELSRFPERNWDLATMSKRAGLSPNYLTQKVRERYHCSLGKYIRLKRIDRAQLLLESTDMGIGEIGLAVGYPNAQHFNKRFRETLGCSPSQFRDSLG